MKHTLITVAIAISCAFRASAAVLLNFDSAVPGTLPDQSGLGTGFTDRLPGTGFSLPLSDPNLDLLAIPGRLSIHSTRADINQIGQPTGANLGNLEAPGVFLPAVGSKDVSISALFRDVRVPNGSDQLMLYFGTSDTNVVRVGFHQLNVYIISENQGIGDMNTLVSGFNAFEPGDDVLLRFARTTGLWQLEWQNLTNPSASGASPLTPIPWLDDEVDIYAGVLASNPGSGISFTGQVEYFTANVVPEPSIGGLLAFSIGFLFGRRRRLPSDVLV